MKKIYKFLITIIILTIILGCTANISTAATLTKTSSSNIKVTIASHTVRINNQVIDSKHSLYPMMVYKEITYLPMTWDYGQALGLSTSWSSAKGLSIKSGSSTRSSQINQYLSANNDLSKVYNAVVSTFPITINGKQIDNSKESWPIFTYNQITYFPLTWHFAHDEFGFTYYWDSKTGFSLSRNDIKIDTTPLVTATPTPTPTPETTDLYPIIADGKGKYINKSGQIVIDSQYDDVYGFSEGLAGVGTINNDGDYIYGFIDSTGKEVIKPQFSNIYSFNEGLAGFKVPQGDGLDDQFKCGYIDKTGKVVIPAQFDEAYNFCEGYAVIVKDDKYGFIDKTGSIVIPAKYDDVWRFNEGLASVEVNGKSGYIDYSGKTVVEPKYDDAYDFQEDMACVEVDGKYGFINKSGNMIISPQFDEADSFSGGLAWIKTENGYGFIDKKGNFVIKPQFDAVTEFREGLACVCIGDKWGYIDTTGKLVISAQYYYSSYFENGLALVWLDEHDYTYIDKNGTQIIKPILYPEGPA